MSWLLSLYSKISLRLWRFAFKKAVSTTRLLPSALCTFTMLIRAPNVFQSEKTDLKLIRICKVRDEALWASDYCRASPVQVIKDPHTALCTSPPNTPMHRHLYHKEKCLREAGTISSVDQLCVNKKLSSCLTVFKKRALVCIDNISPYWFFFILDLWKTCGTANCGCFRTLNCLGCSFPWNQFSQSCFKCRGDTVFWLEWWICCKLSLSSWPSKFEVGISL